jgi:S-formylglutathione hydrolase FrmB
MSLFHAHFFSEALNLQCAADVIMPERPPAGRDLPCLWLLHGLSDDHTAWQRRTNIERYAASYPLAIVMPAVHRSFYADMAAGYAYWTFVSEELPRRMRAFFRLSAHREDNFVAGLSMGGYGAFKLALNLPDRYAAAASLSGVMDICARWYMDKREADLQLVFGPAGPRGGNSDLFHVARQRVADGQPMPHLFQCCGTEDFLYQDNLRFRDFAGEIGLPVHYQEGPGAHDWSYWDARIQDVLRWLPLRTTSAKSPT